MNLPNLFTNPKNLLVRTLIVLFLCGPVMSVLGQPDRMKEPNRLTQKSSKKIERLTPAAKDYPGAIVQVYAARTWGRKGIFAVHTWIATKRSQESRYRILQVNGWRYKYRKRSPLTVTYGRPDRPWYGNPATLLLDRRGDDVDGLIDKIDQAVNEYPYKDTYTIWPGPNSNTFIAYIGLAVPELNLDLPSTAIGKDYRPITQSLGFSASGQGVQASLFGLLSLSLGVQEGVELNLLSLNLELDIFDLALELPGFGRIGRQPVIPDLTIPNTASASAQDNTKSNTVGLLNTPNN